jgi:glycogen debranching enzyme
VKLVTSTSTAEPAFDPRKYWRGPTWPIMDYLLSSGLVMLGEVKEANAIRDASLRECLKGLYEYFDPHTGEGIGSNDQSWTAAAVLMWIREARASQRLRRPQLGRRASSGLETARMGLRRLMTRLLGRFVRPTH